MKVSLIVFLAAVTLCIVGYAEGCGCYGPASCNVQGQFARCTDEGVCDCCPFCNSCNQLLAGCAASATRVNNLRFEPALLPVFNLGQNVGQHFVYLNGSTNSPSYPPCLRPDLPSGLSFSVTNGKIVLSGTPSEIIPPTKYQFISESDVETFSSFSFTISVVDTTNTAMCRADSSQPGCPQEGYMQCVSYNTYQTCTTNGSGVLYWGAIQNCNTALSCNPNGNYIYCA